LWGHIGNQEKWEKILPPFPPNPTPKLKREQSKEPWVLAWAFPLAAWNRSSQRVCPHFQPGLIPLFKEHPTYLAYIQLKNNRSWLFILSIDYRRNNLNTHFELVVFLWVLVKKKFFFFSSHLVPISENPCLLEMGISKWPRSHQNYKRRYLCIFEGSPVVTCALLIICFKRCRGQPRSFMRLWISLAKGTKWNQDQWARCTPH
jgi:hypothetical protein